MRSRFLLSVLLTDMAALLLGMVVAALVVFDTARLWQVSLPPGSSIWPLIGLLSSGGLLGWYVSHRMWAQHVPRPSYGSALMSISLAGSFAAIGIVISRTYWSRPFFVLTLFIWTLLALAHRAVRRRRPWTESMVLITNKENLVADIKQTQHARVIGVFDPSGDPPISLEPTVTVVIDRLAPISKPMAHFVSSWTLAGSVVRPLATTYEEHTGRLPLVHLGEGWEISSSVSRDDYASIKRLVDIVLVLSTAAIWVTLASVIWLAVRLDSRGAGVYTQRRVRRDEHTFTLYKFRTMRANAEADGPQFATVRDGRLTRVGRILRRFRLDEIPQLWNVLKGDLSLVGPRPERPEFTAEFDASIPFYSYRHLLRPGVTGWAQVNYGYADDEADTIEKLSYDLFYVKHASPWLDAQILGRSIWTVLSGFGAQ